MANNETLLLVAAVALLLAYTMSSDGKTEKSQVLPDEDPPSFPMYDDSPKAKKQLGFHFSAQQAYAEDVARAYEVLKTKWEEIVHRLRHFQANLDQMTRESGILTQSALQSHPNNKTY